MFVFVIISQLKAKYYYILYKNPNSDNELREIESQSPCGSFFADHMFTIEILSGFILHVSSFICHFYAKRSVKK